MENDLFRKAMRLLAHPASILALTTLLLNDHLLRRLWPSWWTGKLGDFAWLFFMPFVAAALISMPLGRRARRRDRGVGLAACLLIGGVFALAKTLPAAHAAVVSTASAIFGFSVGWQRDPTDLIALISVFAAWRLWETVGRRQAQRSSARHLPARAVPLLALGGLLTVANSGPPAYGIDEVIAHDGILLACDTYNAYTSADGGLTWTLLQDPPTERPLTPTVLGSGPSSSPLAVPSQESDPRQKLGPPAPTRQIFASPPAAPAPEIAPGQDPGATADERMLFESPLATPGEQHAKESAAGMTSPAALEVVERCRGYDGEPQKTGKIIWHPDQPDIRYRFTPGGSIQRSIDGGETWAAEIRVKPLKPEEYRPLEYRPFYGATNTFVQGPLDGVVDPVTDNVVFAMSHQGVLVRLSSGEWRWVAVGDYFHPSDLQGLLGEVLLAAGFGLAAAATVALGAVGVSLAYAVPVAGVWLLWAVSAYAFPPALTRGAGALAGYGLLLAATLIGFLVTAGRLTGASEISRRTVARIALTGATCAAMFCLPFFLWATGSLPRYGLAAGAATVLGASALYAGWRWTRR